jgi:hypothetical protein
VSRIFLALLGFVPSVNADTVNSTLRISPSEALGASAALAKGGERLKSEVEFFSIVLIAMELALVR